MKGNDLSASVLEKISNGLPRKKRGEGLGKI